MAEFKIYGSSAGSGKTFTLTKEYLKLVLAQEDPRYFKKILAITFTNDAANEMKLRICEALKDFSSEKPSSAVLIEIILNELPNLTAKQLKKRSANIFSEIIHDYTDFGVKTIDSFINQIVSSFSFDLNLPYNYEIRFDQDVLLKEAVDKLIERVGTEDFSDFSELFSDFAFSKIEDEKSWSQLAEELAEFANCLLNDENLFQINKNQDLSIEEYKIIKQNSKNFRKNILHKVKTLAQNALEIIKNEGLTFEDFSYKKSGVFGFYFKLFKKPEELFNLEDIPSVRHLDAFNNGKWSNSKDTEILNKISNIETRLTNLASEILDFQSQKDKFEILEYIESNILKIPLLNFVKTELVDIMKYRNEVFLSEFNRWILDIVVKEPVPFIYERIGEKFNHLLIDEFQDTSNSQFYSLLPLIDNALSNDHYNMIVGDPKQAVYRWRGGNIQLMIDLLNKNNGGLKANNETSEIQYIQIDNVTNFSEKINLGINYRSKQEIINFNNVFFASLSSSFVDSYPFVSKVFEDFMQASPSQSKLGGHVEIEFIEYDKDANPELIRVKEIIDNNLTLGYNLGDFAILCRVNKEASKVADYLKKCGWDINSTDSLKLNTNLEVKFVVALLELIATPDNSFKKFEVFEYFLLIKKIEWPSYEGFNIKNIIDNDVSLIGGFFKNNGFDFDFENAKNLDVFELVETIIDVFKLRDSQIGIHYLYSFLDEIMLFKQNKGKMLVDFLEKWEVVKNKSSVQNTNKNAITVTSIHKSKGLEYPIVILPYANWETEPKLKSEIWYDLDCVNLEELQVNEKRLMSSPFNYSSKFYPEILANQIAIHKEQVFIENLNMLYVAFTRPIDKLYVLSPFNNHHKPKGIGILIENFINNEKIITETPNKYIICYEQIAKVQKLENIEKTEKIIIKNKKIAKKENQLKIKAESNFTNINASERIQIGNVVHAAFENINSKNDVDFAINKLITEGWASNLDMAFLLKRINEVINDPKLSFLYEPDVEVRNEIEILGKNIAVQRPDRVVFIDKKVYIIDYKSGEKKEQHKQQLINYGDLFLEMGYEKVELILIYLEPLEIIIF
jgi:ATP-dependent helicase/nuclease subunit A